MNSVLTHFGTLFSDVPESEMTAQDRRRWRVYGYGIMLVSSALAAQLYVHTALALVRHVH